MCYAKMLCCIYRHLRHHAYDPTECRCKSACFDEFAISRWWISVLLQTMRSIYLFVLLFFSYKPSKWYQYEIRKTKIDKDISGLANYFISSCLRDDVWPVRCEFWIWVWILIQDNQEFNQCCTRVASYITVDIYLYLQHSLYGLILRVLCPPLLLFYCIATLVVTVVGWQLSCGSGSADNPEDRHADTRSQRSISRYIGIKCDMKVIISEQTSGRVFCPSVLPSEGIMMFHISSSGITTASQPTTQPSIFELFKFLIFLFFVSYLFLI